MFKATIRSLLTHKLRLAMTALAIILGVSFVAGTFVLTDTLGKTFDDLFKDVSAGTDVSVRGKTAFDTEGARPPVPDALVEQIEEVDGVAFAEGAVFGFAQFVDKEGEVIAPQGPPTLGVNWGTSDELRPMTLREGDAPVEPDQVAMDAATAASYDFVVGDPIKVLFTTGARDMRVSGIFGFGEADNLAGATLAAFETSIAQEAMQRVGQFDEISIIGEEGVTDRELSLRISDALDGEYDVVTSGEVIQEQSDQIKEGLAFFNGALLAFAFIALFVGSFLIANTFSIIVAQRTRELALLRAIGASRGQVMRSIIIEATITGLVASLIGIGLGVLIALGLRALLDAFGVDIPSGDLVVTSKAIILPIVVGLVVTVVAAIGPARRATKVPPVAALREDFHLPTEISRRRLIIGGIVLTGAVIVLLVGLFNGGDLALSLVGIGAFGTFMGVSAISPVLARPIARFLGAPIARWLHVPGKLARDNSMRNPRRTASTAGALMIGLALISFVAIFASSIVASTTALIRDSTNFDLILQTSNFQGISPRAAEQISQLPEVDVAASLRGGQFRIEDQTKFLVAADLEKAARVIRFEMLEGSIEDAYGGGLLVGEPEAEAQGWVVGDTIRMEFAKTGEQKITIEGIYDRNPLAGNYALSLPDFEKNFQEQLDFLIAVQVSDGSTVEGARSAIDDTIGDDFPNVEVQTGSEYLNEQEDQVNQLLGLVTAMLGLALIIAFIGIVNTLALSIHERIREIGMLRAIGLSRRQLRRMVRWEAVIVSILGALLGLAIGTFFGWAMVSALSDQGISEFRLPFGNLIAYVLLAGLAGVAAAVLPARRAARLDILASIATE